MRGTAHTPEELETLLEDAFVTCDRAALTLLFEDEAVLIGDERSCEVRGGAAIAQFATRMWGSNRTFVADPRRVIQARDTALVVGDRSINVVRRGGDGAWRYAIAVLFLDHTIPKEKP